MQLQMDICQNQIQPGEILLALSRFQSIFLRVRGSALAQKSAGQFVVSAPGFRLEFDSAPGEPLRVLKLFLIRQKGSHRETGVGVTVLAGCDGLAERALRVAGLAL